MLGYVAFSQDSIPKTKNWKLDGYISYMNGNMFDSIQKIWTIDNLIHNRLNFTWNPKSNIEFSAQMRNRLMYGGSNLLIPDYAKSIENDNGWMQLSKNIFQEDNFLLNSNIDRLNLKITKGKNEFQIGRQRINWGQTLVWNPNDIFNASSYFDFDYSEKPGSDAIRYQLYMGPASNFELAVKSSYFGKITGAAKWLFNKKGYDVQLLAGEMEEKEYVGGIGWAGNIKSVGFKGESMYFQPMKTGDSTSACFVATASADYSFSNSLYLLGQVMYTDISKDNPMKDFSAFYQSEMNAKYLSFTDWNIFAMAQYPITPLLSASFGGMYYPRINGFFLNPSITYSLGENSEFGFFWQYFRGDFPNAFGIIQTQQINILFLRVKWSF